MSRQARRLLLLQHESDLFHVELGRHTEAHIALQDIIPGVLTLRDRWGQEQVRKEDYHSVILISLTLVVLGIRILQAEVENGAGLDKHSTPLFGAAESEEDLWIGHMKRSKRHGMDLEA